MYLSKIYDPGACAYRLRYAIANIMRDRVVNEGAFTTCFEMDADGEVVRAILHRGLKNPKLRAALEKSHLIDLSHWLTLHPDYSEAYQIRTACLTEENSKTRAGSPAETT